MISIIVLALLSKVGALDAATSLRKSFNPYVLYSFQEMDVNPSAMSSVDLANHSAINFGNLNFGPRTSWLQGSPGVAMAREWSPNISSAMSATNNFSSAWTTYFNSTPFVIEVWWSISSPFAYLLGSLFSIARSQTSQGTRATSCSSTEPMLDLVYNGVCQVDISSVDNFRCDNCCEYSSTTCRQPNTTSVGVLYVRYDPITYRFTLFQYFTNGTSITKSAFGQPDPIQWSDNQATLRFSSSNNYGVLDFNLFSFAIYPNLSDANISALAQAGLPNAKPVAPNLQRAVPETLGGTIRFCPNEMGIPRDSDCLDYTTRSGQYHVLTSSANLTVFITSLPAQGTLSQNGTDILRAPFRLAGNVVKFTPPSGATSWYASWRSLDNYKFVKTDFTSFTYVVQDPEGVQSNNATVTLEVFPQHTAPIAGNLTETSSNIFAGIVVSPNSLSNSILLQPTNGEFLSLSVTQPRCTPDLIDVLLICSSYKDQPDMHATTINIKSLPATGVLKYKASNGTLVNASVGTQIAVDTSSVCPPPNLPPYCPLAWPVYLEVSAAEFHSSNLILAKVNFTYTVSTNFDLQSYLGNTRYNIDPFQSPQSVNWSLTAESAVANVMINVQNGFYALSSVSSVVQHLNIPPQPIELYAVDMTADPAKVNIQLVIISLPAEGSLFLPGSSTPLTVSDLPVMLSNFTVAYQPRSSTNLNGFEYGDNYSSFQFYAISVGKISNNATQTINVEDGNDPVTISISGNVSNNSIMLFTRVGNPQTWSDLAGNELNVSMFDPDVPQPNEPLYKVAVDGGLDFSVFIEDSIWQEMQVHQELGIGQLVGAGAAGAGSTTWKFIVSRDLAQRALQSLRLRPNKGVNGSSVVITITDCIYVKGLTDPKFNSPNWQSVEVSRVFLVAGKLSERQIEGVAYAGVVVTYYVVIGVLSFIVIICCGCLVRCMYRRGKSSLNRLSKNSNQCNVTRKSELYCSNRSSVARQSDSTVMNGLGTTSNEHMPRSSSTIANKAPKANRCCWCCWGKPPARVSRLPGIIEFEIKDVVKVPKDPATDLEDPPSSKESPASKESLEGAAILSKFSNIFESIIYACVYSKQIPMFMCLLI